MNRDSFVFYKSFYEAIKNVPESSQLELYKAICEYSFTGDVPDLKDGVAKAMFILMKPNIDSATARYKASVENGKKGGRPPKNKNLEKPSNNLDETQEKANENLNVNDNVNVNVNDNYNNNINIDKKEKEKNKKEKEKGYDKIINEKIKNEEIKELIYEFIKMRTLKKKPLTDRALTIQINKLYKISEDIEVQKKVIEKTIVKCWDEFYSLEEEKSSGSYNRHNKSNSGEEYAKFS